MTFPPDFPMKRFLWGFFPWYILLAYCLLNLFYGYYWEAFIRLVEWTLALGPLIYIHIKMFLKWNQRTKEEKNHILDLTGFGGNWHATKEEKKEALPAILWFLSVFASFRFLGI